jgi:hypothetical protein
MGNTLCNSIHAYTPIAEYIDTPVNEPITESVATQTPINKLSITRLPANIQQSIYELTGPCEKTKCAFEKCMKYFKSEKVGIPYWEIIMDRFNIHYTFITPSHTYYKEVKVKRKKWWFPSDLNNDYYKYTDNYSPLLYVKLFHTYSPHLTTTYPYSNYQQSLRNNTFMTPKIRYCTMMIHYWQNRKAPVVPVSFQEVNDYDILYLLEYGRNLNKWAGKEYSLERLYRSKANFKYIYRIICKWEKKGYVLTKIAKKKRRGTFRTKVAE